ncbi:MAG TPA: hypothetical protein ENK85_09040 [Saprospiraceae bacterium]|nr:hypothetical protein [Saprospiraceae bacterium]
MLLRISIITAIFAACLGSIQAQSTDSLFNGTWIGELTQEPGGIALKYPFRIVIEVLDSHKVTGQTYANVYDDPNFAVMSFTGTIFKGKLLTFQETKIIDATVMQDYIWCIKGGQLTLKQEHDQLLLEGYWQGVTENNGQCIPGKIYLKKRLTP